MISSRVRSAHQISRAKKRCASAPYKLSAHEIASLKEHAIIVGRDEAETLLAWFDDHTRKEVQSGGHKLTIEAGAKLNVFTALFAKFSGKIYSGGETREEAVRHIESRLDQLRLNMQIIVRAIEEKLRPRKLLLVLEDLDKIEDRDQGRKLSFEHRPQLLDIPCSAVFTFPIALWYEQEAGVQGYPIRYLLPMIPVTPPPPESSATDTAGQEKAETGRKILRQIVFQRLEENANLIALEALEFLISHSGGVLRDLLYMLREAAIGAKVKNRVRIEIDDVRDAARFLRDEYTNRLSPRTYGETLVTLEDIEQTLRDPADWPRWTVDRTAAFKMLLQSLCILEYNGQRWFELHPAVREYLGIRDAEQKAQRARKAKPASSRKGQGR